MGKVTTDEAGVEKLTGLAKSLDESVTKIENATSTVKDSFEEKTELLGPHTASIKEIVELVHEAQKSGAGAVKGVQTRLLKVAQVIQEFIDKDFRSSSGSNFEKESFSTNIGGIGRTLDIGSGDSSVKQLSGAHKDVRKNDGKGYESHHIPSAAVLQMFGINTDEWPTIALLEEDHKQTDSYAGKQRKRYESIFPDAPPSGTYKEECVEMVDTPGGLEQLIYDEVLNIKKVCGDKYDGAIAQYLDEVEKYVRKHGVPKRKK